MVTIVTAATSPRNRGEALLFHNDSALRDGKVFASPQSWEEAVERSDGLVCCSCALDDE